MDPTTAPLAVRRAHHRWLLAVVAALACMFTSTANRWFGHRTAMIGATS